MLTPQTRQNDRATDPPLAVASGQPRPVPRRRMAAFEGLAVRETLRARRAPEGS